MRLIPQSIFFIDKVSSITSLCPGTETQHTTIQDGLCPPSSWHPSGKRLTVTLGGVWPYLAKSASGGVGGTDPKILDLLAQKFNFSVSFYPINSHKEYYATVRGLGHLHIANIINKLHSYICFSYFWGNHHLVLDNWHWKVYLLIAFHTCFNTRCVWNSHELK